MVTAVALIFLALIAGFVLGCIYKQSAVEALVEAREVVKSDAARVEKARDAEIAALKREVQNSRDALANAFRENLKKVADAVAGPGDAAQKKE